MKRFLNYLTNHSKSNLLIALSYYLLVVFPHEQVGKMVVLVFKNSSRAFYQNAVLIFGSFILGVLLFFFYLYLKENKNRLRLLFYLLITIVFMIVSFNYLIIHNIEIIHFAQYFALSLLLYPLFKSPSKTLFWSILAGTIDEAYQYFILAPNNTNYFDFNDIVLNLLGAALGIVFILSMGYRQRNQGHRVWFKSPEIITFLIIVGGILILSFSGLFSVYPSQTGESALILLVRKTEPDFWTVIPHLNARFHVLRPMEGTIIIFLLWLSYAFIEESPFKNRFLDKKH